MLDDEVTPANRLFVRNHGAIPENKDITDQDWTLTIDGEVGSPAKLTIADLEKTSKTLDFGFNSNAPATAARSSSLRLAAINGPLERSAARNGPACGCATCCKN